MQTDLFGLGGAVFSDDRVHRYTLTRVWDRSREVAMFIGLNPSTADETQDDPTIRRCTRFARDWGFGGLVMTNIFAFRSTDPNGMKAARDPVGPDNDDHILKMAMHAGVIVCAWGAHGVFMDRGLEVVELLRGFKLKIFKTTKSGMPVHPLYQRADAPLKTYEVIVNE